MATLKLFLGFECPNLGGENVAAGALDSPLSFVTTKKIDRILSVAASGNADLRTAAELATFVFGYVVSDQAGTLTLAAAGTAIPVTANVPFIIGASSAAVGTVNFINTSTNTATLRGAFFG